MFESKIWKIANRGIELVLDNRIKEIGKGGWRKWNLHERKEERMGWNISKEKEEERKRRKRKLGDHSRQERREIGGRMERSKEDIYSYSIEST